MEPLTMLVSALVAGAVAATKDVTTQAVKDGYAALKNLMVRKFGSKGDVEGAIQNVESKPDSSARHEVLKEELVESGAALDAELLEQARNFMALLKKHGMASGPSYQAELHGEGAIAQGTGAVAAGKGGVAIGGSVQGNIVIGKE